MSGDRITCPECGADLAYLEWDGRAGVAHVRLERGATLTGTHFCPAAASDLPGGETNG